MAGEPMLVILRFDPERMRAAAAELDGARQAVEEVGTRVAATPVPVLPPALALRVAHTLARVGIHRRRGSTELERIAARLRRRAELAEQADGWAKGTAEGLLALDGGGVMLPAIWPRPPKRPGLARPIQFRPPPSCGTRPGRPLVPGRPEILRPERPPPLRPGIVRPDPPARPLRPGRPPVLRDPAPLRPIRLPDGVQWRPASGWDRVADPLAGNRPPPWLAPAPYGWHAPPGWPAPAWVMAPREDAVPGGFGPVTPVLERHFTTGPCLAAQSGAAIGSR